MQIMYNKLSYKVCGGRNAAGSNDRAIPESKRRDDLS